MTDKELLKFAAKAAGIEVAEITPQGGFTIYGKDREKYWWNPLSADDDALRLVVKLKLELYFAYDEVETACVGYVSDTKRIDKYTIEGLDIDPYAATRKAIVRAAAEIGKAMP